MKKTFNRSLFIFRRDLRLNDNIGLTRACAESADVIPCFIFDPQQVGRENEFRSMNAIQFMVTSLKELGKDLKKNKGKLYLFYGNPEKVVETLIKKTEIDAVFCNKDYTPFSIKRDVGIKKVCFKHDIAFQQYDDAILNPPNAVTTGNGDPYSVFTPFFKKASLIPVEKPKKIPTGSWYTKKIPSEETTTLYTKLSPDKNPNIIVGGGREEGLSILRSLKKFKDYAKERDFPAIPTTHLSAHNKFGTISIRELYYAIAKKLGAGHPLIRQLYWRDFFIQVAYHSPFVFGEPFHQKYKNLWWSRSKKMFDLWCTGTTGFPIVDAGMRQLNTTGYMHNRTRMIVASFLTKDLHINWLWGEKYFAQQLVDYDPCVNNGSWQWAASTGCDAQPYFRIFNPWLQQKKFDPECVYIKEWIPELRDAPIKLIHGWETKYDTKTYNYPKPIINHKTESAYAKELFKKAGYYEK